MKNATKTLALVMAGAMLTGCSGKSISQNVPKSVQTINSVADEQPEENTDTLPSSSTGETGTWIIPLVPNNIAYGTNKLAGCIFPLLETEQEATSAVFSGFSAYSALSEAEVWADEAGKMEFAAALGQMNYDALKEYKDTLPVETGTMFLVDDMLPLNTDKTDGFIFTDMHENAIVELVNTFVNEKTHGMIPTIIDTPFEAEQVAAVLDTLYFKGTWEYQFNREGTKARTFYGKTNEKDVDFMYNCESYGVDVVNGIVELPYADTTLVMDIMYDTKDTMTDTYDNFLTLIDSNNLALSYGYDVGLYLPKFETETTVILNNACESAGLAGIFKEPRFSPLADDISIGVILQKAKIIVDEEGTEAAAATLMTFDVTSVREEKEYLEIDVNKPFAYVIRDTETNVILFSGYINDF